MCYFIALAIPKRIADPQAYFSRELVLEDAGDAPLGAAAAGGRTDARAYLLTTGMCSCHLMFKSRRTPHLVDALTNGLTALLRDAPSIGMVVHVMTGQVATEQVPVTEKRHTTPDELRAAWPEWKLDVRYVLATSGGVVQGG